MREALVSVSEDGSLTLIGEIFVFGYLFVNVCCQ